MRVDEKNGSWIIVDDAGAERGCFDSSAAAWRALDRMAGEPVSPAEKRSDFAWQASLQGVMPSVTGIGSTQGVGRHREAPADGIEPADPVPVAARPGRRRLRPITTAEIEASRTAKGGLSRKQLAAWGISWPPRGGWRKRILRYGVPVECPFPPGFSAAKGADFPVASNPTLAFSAPKPAAAIPADALVIFTDGSASPNPGPGGWGFVVYRGGVEIHAASGGELAATNNRMELRGIIEALRWLEPTEPAIVRSDSQYVVKGCIEWRHGWKRKAWTRGPKAGLANADLWQELDALLDTCTVDVRWTRGHVGTAGNEQADELAAIGRQSVLEAA